MRHPFIARKMNRLFTNSTAEQLSPELVDYATTVVRGLHVALREQTQPPYHRPEDRIDGWKFTATPLEEHGDIHGFPTVSLLGHRAVYLSTRPDVMLRVLTAPHPHRIEDRVIQIRSTSVPNLLQEDPTLYYGLLNAADESIEAFELDYQVPELPPLSPIS